MENYKPLWYHLLNLIKQTRIYVSINRILRKKFFKENPLQSIAVDMLIFRTGLDFVTRKGRVIVSKKYMGKDYLFLYRKGDIESDLVYPGKTLIYEELEKRVPQKPLFAVLNMLYYEHTPGDRKRLGLQLSLMVNIIRRWLWDKHLIFVETPLELQDYVTKYIGKNRVIYISLNDFCELIRQCKNPIALDPYSNNVITEHVVKNADIIMIGGIVDRERPLKRATSKLISLVEEKCSKAIQSYRMELNGFKTPVPHRLNRVLEILLKVLFEGYPLNKAIITSMSNRDLAWYIGLMMQKKIDYMKFIQELEMILGKKISKEVLLRARRIAGLS